MLLQTSHFCRCRELSLLMWFCRWLRHTTLWNTPSNEFSSSPLNIWVGFSSNFHSLKLSLLEMIILPQTHLFRSTVRWEPITQLNSLRKLGTHHVRLKGLEFLLRSMPLRCFLLWRHRTRYRITGVYFIPRPQAKHTQLPILQVRLRCKLFTFSPAETPIDRCRSW
jgi:hypothetical protein